MRCGLFAVGLLWMAGVVGAEGQAAKAACGPDRMTLSDGDEALLRHRFVDAKALYGEALSADPASTVAMAGLVRTALAEGKLTDALAMIQKDDAAHPNDAALLDTMGEVRFRRGEVDEAIRAFNRSVALNPCSGTTHFDMARFLNLSGMYGSAQRQLEAAHSLSPNNLEITTLWKSTHAAPLTPEEKIAALKKRLESASITAEQKDAVEAAIKGIEAQQRGNCELVDPVAEVKLPIVPISTGSGPTETMYAAGLDLKINGKKRRFEIDTGNSGLVLRYAVAKSAGLVPEFDMKVGGIGSGAQASAFVTHVDDIKIGAMEFKNCMVRVMAAGSLLDKMPGDLDGLIGPDVFRNYLVTLDIPGYELRLGPLPRRPDAEQAVDTALSMSADDATASMADKARDRYVAPEMKDWTPVYRSGHLLIVPTFIGDAPVKLFLIDSGESRSMISPAAAQEVAQGSKFVAGHVNGISGQVQNHVLMDKVSIRFANVEQVNRGLNSYDFGGISRSAGVDLSGAIGFPMIREVVLSIDYRDNLIHVVYDAKKGNHIH